MSREFSEIDTDTPKGRLLAFCRMTGLSSNREIEKLLDLGNGYFRSADKGMNTGSICKIAKKYPTLNLNWLICGCGNIYSEDNTRLCSAATTTLAVAEPHPYYNVPPLEQTDVKVPVRMFDSPAAFSQRDNGPLPARWFMLEKSFLRHSDDALVKITDDCLSPQYPAGEYLQVSRCAANALSNLHENEKRLYLIALDGTPPIARLTGHYKGHPNMYLLSALHPDRENFPDIVCSLSQVSSLWEVANVLHV